MLPETMILIGCHYHRWCHRLWAYLLNSWLDGGPSGIGGNNRAVDVAQLVRCEVAVVLERFLGCWQSITSHR